MTTLPALLPREMFFTSLTGSISALLTGRVGLPQLRTGLFVFGCWRSQCLSPQEPIPPVVRSNPIQHRILVSSVLAAEQDNRARWVDPNDPYSWQRQINALLMEHGYPAVLQTPPTHAQPTWVTAAWLTLVPGLAYISPSHHDVERAITQARLPLEVIWRGR